MLASPVSALNELPKPHFLSVDCAAYKRQRTEWKSIPYAAAGSRHKRTSRFSL
ncbi:MAG: hypothetical protein ABW189_00265 [Rickettsiales bacterium]